MPNPNDQDPFVSAEQQQAYRDMLSAYLAQPPRREAFFEAYIEDPNAAPGDDPFEVRAFPVEGVDAAPPDPFGMGGMFQPPFPARVTIYLTKRE
jgi:hypothetical protein